MAAQLLSLPPYLLAGSAFLRKKSLLFVNTRTAAAAAAGIVSTLLAHSLPPGTRRHRHGINPPRAHIRDANKEGRYRIDWISRVRAVRAAVITRKMFLVLIWRGGEVLQ